MTDEKKTSVFKKIFGQKSSCCSVEIEEIESEEEKSSESQRVMPNCSCGGYCPVPNNDEKDKDKE
jgi:hypothetical protein